MRRKIKKELVEWIILIGVVGLVYLGGWHTEIIGRIQQVVLAAGMIEPDRTKEEKKADYNFLLRDASGNSVPFSTFEGEIVFVNFWATWCPPCVAEMPDIHKLYQSRKDEVQFVMISLDKDPSKAEKFIEQKGFTFPIYFLSSRLPDSYNIGSIPTTYLIDKKGHIRVENQGMAKYNSESFNELLDELSETQ